MQLANFIAVQPVQNFLIQLRGIVVKNNLAFGHADNPRAIFTHQLHRMQVYHYADALFAKEGANKRGNSSRLTQSFHFFMFEPIFSPVNALNQPI